jgi:cell wall-associated NlpC family hydrolase
LRFAAFIKPVESTALNAIKDKKARDPIVKSIEGRKASAEDIKASMDLTNKQFQNQAFIENWVANQRLELPDAPTGPGLPDILGAALTGALGGAFGVRSNVAGNALDIMGARQQTDYASQVAKIQNQQRERQDFLKRSGGIRDDMARQFNTQADDLRLLENAITDDETALYKIDKASRDRYAIEKAKAKYKMDELEFKDRVSLAYRVAEAQGIPLEQAMGVVFAKENKDIQTAADNKRKTDAQISRIVAQNKVSAETAAKIAEQAKLLPSENHRKWEETRSRIERNKNLNKFGELNQLRKDYVDLLGIMEDSISTTENEVAELTNQLGAMLEVRAATGAYGTPAVDERTINEHKNKLNDAYIRLEAKKNGLEGLKAERGERIKNASQGAVKTATTAAGFKPGAVCTDATDCSMFAQRTMASMGLKIPPTTATQIKAGKSLVGKGGALKPGMSPTPGDLVFFTTRQDGQVSHVGVYVGDGKFRHASSTGKRGPSRNKGLQYMYKEERLEDYIKRVPLVDIRRYSA